MVVKITLIAFLLFAGIALPTTQIETHLSCTGECAFNQTTNNRSIELSSNESLVVSAVSSVEENSTEVETNISVNATGAGTAAVDGTGNIVAATDGSRREETGIINAILNFLRSFSFLGWFR